VLRPGRSVAGQTNLYPSGSWLLPKPIPRQSVRRMSRCFVRLPYILLFTIGVIGIKYLVNMFNDEYQELLESEFGSDAPFVAIAITIGTIIAIILL
jgi:hypothetical protein